MREVTFPNYFFIDDSMDLNSKSVEEKIRQYRVFKSCSQSTLMGLCEVANHPMSQARLCALASGFSGGIGGTFDEGTCGALTGALIALGFLEDDEIYGSDEDVVVKTKSIEPVEMSLDDAIMKMELLGHDFFIYTDDETQKIAVVYKRYDGGYGLIETE